MNSVIAWEENGKFYFSDGFITIETTELLDTDSLVYNVCVGWAYNGTPLDAFTIREV